MVGKRQCTRVPKHIPNRFMPFVPLNSCYKDTFPEMKKFYLRHLNVISNTILKNLSLPNCKVSLSLKEKK